MGKRRGKNRGDVTKNGEERGREERKDSYKENMLRRKGGCQAVAAEFTEHGISNAVKLENARQQSRLGQHSEKNCLVRVRD